METQIINGRYLDRSKLVSYLNARFGSNWTLQVSIFDLAQPK